MEMKVLALLVGILLGCMANDVLSDCKPVPIQFSNIQTAGGQFIRVSYGSWTVKTAKGNYLVQWNSLVPNRWFLTSPKKLQIVVTYPKPTTITTCTLQAVVNKVSS